MSLEEPQRARAQAWFTRHRGTISWLGRCAGFVGALPSFVAGASVMPYRRFLPYNAAGAVLWASGFVLLGYGLEAGWRRVEHWTNAVSALVGGGLALLIGLVWLRRRFERRVADVMRT